MDPPNISLTADNGDRISNVSNILAAGSAHQMSNADQKLQMAENAISVATGHVTTAQGFYAANNTAINEAFKAVGNLIASDATKKLTSDVLHVAKKVISALDAVQGVHPFIGAAVLIFKGVIALEMKRRANDQRVSGLILTATDMMSELLSLNNLTDPDQTLPSGQTIRGRLQVILEQVLSTIEACGNAVDKYHKSKTISKFFKAMSWEEKFEGFLQSFQSLKKEIKNALIIRSALRIEDAITSIEQVDIKLDLILKMIHTRPKIDEDIAKEVAERGGADVVLNNSVKIKEITDEIAKKGVTGIDRSKSSDKTVEASLLHELRTPLETQLEENRQLYQVSLELATNEIKDAIKHSESRILHAFNKGAYVRVKDPHLRYVWRIMRWSPSVQAKYFIPALHDYFSEQVGSATRRRDILNSTTSAPPSPSLTAQTAEDDEEPPALSSEDEWCLSFLGVTYLPALKETFDENANGLVSVREVNEFAWSKSMPESWSILKRLAYAAVGWRHELWRYGINIQMLYNRMVFDSNSVLPENRSFVCWYLNSYAHKEVKALAQGITDASWSDSSEIAELVTERVARHEAHLDQLLARIRYEIPSVELMNLYFDNDHVEHFIMPVIWVLLLRHARLINLAKTVPLDRRELELCETTLYVVLAFTDKRVDTLAESLRQQSLNVNDKFATFYGGLYRIHYDKSKMSDKMEYWDWYGAPVDGAELETLTSESDTRFGSPDPLKIAYGPEWHDEEKKDGTNLSMLSPIQRFQHVANHVLKKVQQTRRWDFLRARRAAIKEYETIAVAAALDSLVWTNDGPRYLSEAGQETLNRLALVLSPRDLAYCRAKGEMEMSKSYAVHNSSCDGCHRSPIANVRYDCLDCPQKDYQLCGDCVKLPTEQHAYPSDAHTLQHNMNLLRAPIPSVLAQLLRSHRHIIANAVPKHDADGVENPASVEVAETLETGGAEEDEDERGSVVNKTVAPIVENCTECNKELPGEFFACKSCPENGEAILILCNECAFNPELAKACSDHSFADHFLVLVRNRNASYIHGEPEPESKDKSEDEEPTMKSLQAQMSKMLEMIEELRTSMAALNRPAPQ